MWLISDMVLNFKALYLFYIITRVTCLEAFNFNAFASSEEIAGDIYYFKLQYVLFSSQHLKYPFGIIMKVK